MRNFVLVLLIIGIQSQYLVTVDNDIIDFQDENLQFFDQVHCSIIHCQCVLTIQNLQSGELWAECQDNTLTLERSNKNITKKDQNWRIAAVTYSDSDMPNSLTVDSQLTIKWKFNDDGTIEFATIWNKLSYLGLGFGSTMRNTDMITINVSGSTVNLIDLYSTSTNTPSTDSSQDYTIISYSVGASSVSTRFKRKLSTGDSKDSTLTKGSTYSWCYAYSSSLSMNRHSAYSVFSITLSDTTATNSSGSSSTSTGSTSGSTGTSSSGSTGSTSSSTGTTSSSGTSSSGGTSSSSGTSGTSNTSGSTSSSGSTTGSTGSTTTSTGGTNSTGSSTGTSTNSTGTSTSSSGSSTGSTSTNATGTSTSSSGSSTGSTSSTSTGSGTSSSGSSGSSSTDQQTSGTNSTSSSNSTQTTSASSNNGSSNAIITIKDSNEIILTLSVIVIILI